MARTILSWALWPLSVAVFIAAVIHLSDLGNSASIYTAVGRVIVVALVVQLSLELVIPYRADWRVTGDRDIWRDIGHLVLYVQGGGIAAKLLLLSGLASILAPLRLPVWPTHSPLLTQVLLVIVAGDGLEYWLHRLSHAIPLLWRVHAIHHMPTRLHILKAGRHHFLYVVLRALIVWTPLLIAGAPADLLVWQFFAIALTGNIAHANIDFRIPAFVHRLLVTPHFHRIHHSADAAEGNSNYGVLLPVWDMVFGSHADPLKTEVGSTGIEGDPIPHKFLAELFAPFAGKTRG